MIAQAQPAAPPAIEIRVGGAMEPQPHAVWVSVMPDGTILRRGAPVAVPREAGTALIDGLCASALATLDSAAYGEAIARLRARPEVEGGSGVYTIAFRCGGVMRVRTLDFPGQYADSSVPAARAFADLVLAARALVEPLR